MLDQGGLRWCAAILASGLLAACLPTPGEMVTGRADAPVVERSPAEAVAAAYGSDIALMRHVAAHAEHAMLAWLAYENAGRDGALRPRGWRLIGRFEDDFEGSGDLAAKLFSGPDGQVVLAFRGTDQWEDWVADNASSVLQTSTPMLERARALAAETKAAHPGVVFVGHSLGGRLAIIASIATGNRAVVFDSAFPSLADTTLTRAFRGGSAPDFVAFSSPWDPVAGFTAFDGTKVRNYPKYVPRRNPANPDLGDIFDPVLFYHDPGLLARAMAEVKAQLPVIEAAM